MTNKDRLALDLPYYDGLLAGRHLKEPGYSIRREAGTDDWLLIATVEGVGRIGTRSGERTADPGSLTLISPRTPHDYGTARGASVWDILWVHFEPFRPWLELLHWPMARDGVAVLEPTVQAWKCIVPAFRSVLSRSLASGRRRREFAMNSLEMLLLLCEDALPRAGARLDDRVDAAISHILSHLHQEISVTDLAARTNLSSSRFAHLFRGETGIPPLQYVQLQRMRRARTLLERTSHSVGEVAAEVGMAPFHFSTRFKEETGLSPRAYRDSFTARECTAVHR